MTVLVGRLVISAVVVVLRLGPSGLPLALAPDSTNYKVIKETAAFFNLIPIQAPVTYV